ncbi:MAG: hypothetical protein ACOZDY_03145 [Pseudomonadota bacterium]
MKSGLGKAAVLALSLGAVSCATPGSGPSQVEAPAIRTGDSWTYEVRIGYSDDLKATLRYQVVGSSGDALQFSVSGEPKTTTQSYTREWNPLTGAVLADRKVDFPQAYPRFSFPLGPGKTWVKEAAAVDPAGGRRMSVKVHARVSGWERIKVPAGEFNALRIDRQIYVGDYEWWRSESTVLETDWYAPEVKAVVKRETRFEYWDHLRGRNGRMYGDNVRLELAAYRPGP